MTLAVSPMEWGWCEEHGPRSFQQPGFSPFTPFSSPSVPVEGTGVVLCSWHPTPAISLRPFSACTKQMMNSQLLMAEHCLSFAPLYLQDALQFQGIVLSLPSLSLLFCPVTDDGFLQGLALQDSTGVVATK